MEGCNLFVPANKYLFVSTGTDLIGNNYVDLFDFGTGLNGFTSGNALLPGAQAFSENQWVYDEYVALPGLKIHRNRAISHADAVFGSNPELESSFNAAQYPGGELKEVPNIGDQPLPGAKEASVDMEYAHMDGSFTLEQLYLFIFHAHPETINGKPAVQFPSPDDIDEANHGGIEHRIRVVYSPAHLKTPMP